MRSISPSELATAINQEEPLTLIDVREPFEHELYNIGGELIPLAQLLDDTGRIPSEGKVVLYCQKGIRSALAIQRLEQRGFKNLVNLTGGLDAWKTCFPV